MNQSEEMAMNGDVNKLNNVYVKNLSEDLDDEDLQEMFKPFGTILSAKVLKTYDGKKRGCGFVSFMEPESAGKAIEGMNGKEVKGKVLYAGYAQKKAERHAELRKEFERMNMDSPNRYQFLNLYVKNLDDVIDDEWLRKEFSQFGKITSAKVMTIDGKSRGFGFVCFSLLEEARKALTIMNGRIIVKKPLYVAFAQRKEERRAQLATHYMHRLVTMEFQAQQMDQMFPPGGAAYYVPPMPEGIQQNFFAPQAIPQMGAGHNWHTVQPNQPTAEFGFQNVCAGPQVRPVGPAAPVQTSMHHSLNMSALTGQNTQPWPTMPVMQNNLSGHPIAVSVASQQAFPYSVNMFTMTGQNTAQPWVPIPLMQNNVSEHPLATSVTSHQAYPYKQTQPMLNFREADADHFHRPVISPSPSQRSLTMSPWSLSSSPRSLSPSSPTSFMRFLTPPPRQLAEQLRPRPPHPAPSMYRNAEPFNSDRTAWDMKEFEETNGANTDSEEPNHLRYFLDVLDKVRQTLLDKIDIVVRREFVFEDLNRIYGGEEEPEILRHRICVEFEGEMEKDSGGLTRDMFALYWNYIIRFFFHGEAAKVPYVPRSRFLESQTVFRAAGRILTHALLLTGSLPLDISVSFLWSAIKPSLPPTDETVLKDFCNFVSAADARAIRKGLEGTAGVYSDVLMSQLMDIFTRFGMNNIPSPKHFRQQVLMIARVELIAKPLFFGQIMMSGIPNLWMTNLWSHISEYGLIEMYGNLQPTPQKVLQKLKTETDEEYLSNPQQRAFICLKDFIRCLDSEALAQFLHFTTGSTSMPAEPIVVSINNRTGLNRIPKAHTNGTLLEISTAYSSPLEFRHELGAIIFKDQLYAMSST
ncbi:hypothetical protein CHS0354_036093 [Potamilus streckersoni]|uniref:Uncharacterized protein n=1 Tax=Potamilus streckersoni TaxID=2493646 RepID=A0AAE0SZI6_9BIVA|nr:hypothetical protein CHS0354_036093 [Potamilus streckersoni]